MLRLVGLRGCASLCRIRMLPRISAQASSPSSSEYQHYLFTTKTSKPDWMVQAEIEAIAANKGRQIGGDTMMSRLEHEFQSERISNTLKQEDKLRLLIQKCNENRGDTKLFNAIRKRALTARQELIVQREAAGMGKDTALNASTVEAAFPIPASV